MKKLFTALMMSAALLSACNENDDIIDDGFTSEITIDGDVDCCSADEARIVYNFLKNVKEVPELADTIDGTYRLHAYTSTGKLQTGFNYIYFVVTKLKNANYVKDITIENFVPLMTMNMGEKTMKHSTPIGGNASVIDGAPAALKRAWVSFMMPSDGEDKWAFSYDLNILSKGAETYEKEITVNPFADGQVWLKTFKANDNVYVLSLVEPNKWQTGTNEIKAYVSVKSSPMTNPYQLANEQFVIEQVPTMPDMGNHSSPDNTALTLQGDGSYVGSINLTMTGLWRIHLTIRDAATNEIVAGGDEESDGFSSLFWDVTI
ncbi:MAG: FixH family protein [Bacteroidales bacterium]|nr:FixH family protein [Bacteroidales bacterium]